MLKHYTILPVKTKKIIKRGRQKIIKRGMLKHYTILPVKTKNHKKGKSPNKKINHEVAGRKYLQRTHLIKNHHSKYTSNSQNSTIRKQTT